MSDFSVRELVNKTIDFPSYLQNELVRRIGRNPRYSLRAFARDLQVDASLLSKILNRKRTVSRSLFNHLSTKLECTEFERELFGAKLGYYEPADVHWPESDYHQLNPDEFRVISEWYHFALFELVRLKDFRDDPQWMATRLGITVVEVQDALDRMQKIGLLKKTRDGYVRTCMNISSVDNRVSREAGRKRQKQILDLAKTALDEVEITKREQSSITMAIDSRYLPQAKAIIAQFRRDLSDLLQAGKNFDQVYELSIGLVPLTRVKKEQSYDH